MAEEIELHGHSYRIGKLNLLKQFHIARKVAPVLAGLGPLVVGMINNDGPPGEDTLVSVLPPLAEALSNMTDADSEYVIRECLSVVTRKQGEAWSRVRADSGAMMFEDIDLPVLLRLTVEVISENLGSFLRAPAQ